MKWLSRVASLKGLGAHSDLLVFQLGNWASGQLLFAIFGAFSAHGTLAHVAFVETASAFFGTTFAMIAFRMGFESVFRMRMLVAARVAILLAMALVAFGGWIEWTWVIGVAPSLLTPAHFPVVFGARKRALALLVGGRVLACVVCGSFTLAASTAFAVYFAPGIAYACAFYVFHFDDWARPSASGRRGYVPAAKPDGTSLDALVFLPLASAGFFFMQASLVSHIAAASTTWAVFERLMRSGYSLLYPYVMRIARFEGQLRWATGALGLLLPPAAALLSSMPAVVVAVWIPVLIDVVATNLFRMGRERLRVFAVWASLCAGWVAVGPACWRAVLGWVGF
jgi:hypothetical protein